MWSDRVPKVRDVGIAVHGQSTRRPLTVEARRMKREGGNIDHVSLSGDHDAVILDRVANLPGHDKPELGAFRMIMAAVFRIQWRQVFFVTVNNVGHSSVVMDKSATMIGRSL